jgi:hypothetical protein
MSARGALVVVAGAAAAVAATRYLPVVVSIVRSTRTLLAVDISSVIQPTKDAKEESIV